SVDVVLAVDVLYLCAYEKTAAHGGARIVRGTEDLRVGLQHLREVRAEPYRARRPGAVEDVRCPVDIEEQGRVVIRARQLHPLPAALVYVIGRVEIGAAEVVGVEGDVPFAVVMPDG